MPLACGNLPLLTLPDLDAFALKIFGDRGYWSSNTLNTVSHFATGQETTDTLQRVAGVKAGYQRLTIKEWLAELPYADAPVATMDPEGITVGQNFSMWWPGFQESMLLQTRDIQALKKLYPGMQSLELWMKNVGYDGSPKPVLKGFIDNSIGPDF